MFPLALLLGGCDVELDPPRISEPQQHLCVYGEPISFARGGDSHRIKLTGWSQTEPGWTWTDGIGASLMIQVRPSNQPLTLRLKASPFVHPPQVPFQPVHVSVNGNPIAQWHVDTGRTYRAVIPQDFVGGAQTIFAGHPADPHNVALIYIDFYMPKAQAPFAVGAVWDWRRLGLCCSELVITEGAEPGAAEDHRTDDAPSTPDGSPYTLGAAVKFGLGEEAAQYKLRGWHEAERNYTWMGEGEGAVLGFLLAEDVPSGQPLLLKAKVSGNAIPPRVPAQPTLVFANQRQIAEWSVTQLGKFTARIPADVIMPGRALIIEFRTPKAISPKALGANNDERLLGVAFHELSIDVAKASRE